jgi:hypothetical protein
VWVWVWCGRDMANRGVAVLRVVPLARLLAYTLIFGSAADMAKAFEIFPEFSTLSEQEEVSFTKPVSIDPTYGGLEQSYRKSDEWERLWFGVPVAVDGTVGSIDGKHFLISNRAKFYKALSSHFEFRFTHFEDRDLEVDRVATILEMIYWSGLGWPVRRVGISVYGEPSFFKRQNDMGVALLLNPSPMSEIRLFNTFVDVVRNDRNDRTDRFEGSKVPYSFGFVGRHWNGKAKPDDGDVHRTLEYVEYAVRYETDTHWRFPDARYDYRYWKKFASVSSNISLSPKVALNMRVQFDQKFEAKILDGAGPVAARPASLVDEAWTNERLLTVLRFPLSSLGSWQLTPGLSVNYRRWRASGTGLPTASATGAAGGSGSGWGQGDVTYLDWIPHGILKIPLSDADNSDSMTFEYALSLQKQSGESSLRSRPDNGGPWDLVEHRLSVSYDVMFSNTGSLRIIPTFDVGRLLSRPWGGGNAQFRMEF